MQQQRVLVGRTHFFKTNQRQSDKHKGIKCNNKNKPKLSMGLVLGLVLVASLLLAFCFLYAPAAFLLTFPFLRTRYLGTFFPLQIFCLDSTRTSHKSVRALLCMLNSSFGVLCIC